MVPSLPTASLPPRRRGVLPNTRLPLEGTRDTGSGVSGLFWVDGDTHTWKNGQHLGKFKLNYRNTMNEVSAGREI